MEKVRVACITDSPPRPVPKPSWRRCNKDDILSFTRRRQSLDTSLRKVLPTAIGLLAPPFLENAYSEYMYTERHKRCDLPAYGVTPSVVCASNSERGASFCSIPHRDPHTEYIPATFHDVNTAVCKTSRTIRPRDLCKDAPRCPDEPNKEAFNDARWMTGHVGHPRPPSASHAPQTPMFQTKEP
ncbi:hypothetical protein EVAR_79871_1 [Eumeta japonica]|uniref:Uncharacterized protein n=1 Tax=Eumeta variegata TaxID=151549 RepID=A0A4C1TYW9_EUMVA|nr:hypothetical protein EVAR_79871_1 [Eumeta japonica]